MVRIFISIIFELWKHWSEKKLQEEPKRRIKGEAEGHTEKQSYLLNHTTILQQKYYTPVIYKFSQNFPIRKSRQQGCQ